jgi:hypothetical protein
LAEFISGEGCFLVNIVDSKSKLKKTAQMRFVITQHVRDEKLLKSLISYFGCGIYSLRKDTAAGDYIVQSYNDIINQIIPFLDKYPI